jgi:DNA-directed RNA polymerase specialized sigma24 family protein
MATLLEYAWPRLNEQERDACVLRFFGNGNFREIGRALGCSERAAKQRVVTGLEKLLHEFQESAAWVRRQQQLQT